MLYPLPAVLVTVADENGKDNIITVAWAGTVCTNPPMVSISVRPERYSYAMLCETKEFVINLTTEKMAFATDYCGVKSGRDVDKFKEMSLTPEKADVVNCPMIKEAPINLECRVLEVKSYPTHDMFIAEIVTVHADDEIVDGKGKIDMSAAGLIAYVHGEYFGLKKSPLGRFGYSVMKPKTRKRINRQKHEERVLKNKEKRKGR